MDSLIARAHVLVMEYAKMNQAIKYDRRNPKDSSYAQLISLMKDMKGCIDSYEKILARVFEESGERYDGSSANALISRAEDLRKDIYNMRIIQQHN